jgi:hypothetical protein
MQEFEGGANEAPWSKPTQAQDEMQDDFDDIPGETPASQAIRMDAEAAAQIERCGTLRRQLLGRSVAERELIDGGLCNLFGLQGENAISSADSVRLGLAGPNATEKFKIEDYHGSAQLSSNLLRELRLPDEDVYEIELEKPSMSQTGKMCDRLKIGRVDSGHGAVGERSRSAAARPRPPPPPPDAAVTDPTAGRSASPAALDFDALFGGGGAAIAGHVGRPAVVPATPRTRALRIAQRIQQVAPPPPPPPPLPLPPPAEAYLLQSRRQREEEEEVVGEIESPKSSSQCKQASEREGEETGEGEGRG